jgi:WD40 repeat protein
MALLSVVWRASKYRLSCVCIKKGRLMLLYEDHKSDEEHKGVVYSLAFSPDGSALVSAGKDGALFLRDAFGQRHSIIEREDNSHPIHSVAYADDGTLVVGGGFGWQVYRQDNSGSWHVHGLNKTTPTNSLAILDDNTLAVGTGDRLQATPGALELWDLNTGRKREPRFPEPNGVSVVAACPSRRRVAWVAGHRQVRVWETLKQKKPTDFNQLKSCRAIAFNPEGTHIAAAVDYGVKIYNLERGTEKFELRHGGRVEAVAYSPDGSTLATGSWDQTVKLWDAASGQERATYKWPIGRVHCLVFAPDGLRLTAGGDQGTVVVWDVD